MSTELTDATPVYLVGLKLFQRDETKTSISTLIHPIQTSVNGWRLTEHSEDMRNETVRIINNLEHYSCR